MDLIEATNKMIDAGVAPAQAEAYVRVIDALTRAITRAVMEEEKIDCRSPPTPSNTMDALGAAIKLIEAGVAPAQAEADARAFEAQSREIAQAEVRQALVRGEIVKKAGNKPASKTDNKVESKIDNKVEKVDIEKIIADLDAFESRMVKRLIAWAIVIIAGIFIFGVAILSRLPPG